MTREELRQTLHNLAMDRVNGIVNAAEPLFEEIKKLKLEIGERNDQWLKTYHDTEARAVYHEAATATMNVQIESLEEEIEELNLVLSVRDELSKEIAEQTFLLLKEKDGEIEELTKDRDYFHDLNEEMIGMMKEKDIKIKQLETDISDLTFCESCEQSVERLKDTNLFPPMYCHKCKYPELHELFDRSKVTSE